MDLQRFFDGTVYPSNLFAFSSRFVTAVTWLRLPAGATIVGRLHTDAREADRVVDSGVHKMSKPSMRFTVCQYVHEVLGPYIRRSLRKNSFLRYQDEPCRARRSALQPRIVRKSSEQCGTHPFYRCGLKKVLCDNPHMRLRSSRRKPNKGSVTRPNVV
jgi:hypothetical protein